MAEVEKAAHLGLPWPDEFRELRPLLVDGWGVRDDIYLHHQLSGKSGAAVYAADISCADFSGQAILKFDRSQDSEAQEKTEAERHQLAFEATPDFAREHLPKLLHTLHHGECLAILSSIAGRGLEYAKPWAECPHDSQLAVNRQLSRDLLEDWNRGHALAKGLHGPEDLLRSWLDYRLDPRRGRIHSFLKDFCGLSSEESSVVFEGQWYPNPLAFLGERAEHGNGSRLRAVVGNVHGDLHGHNVLVNTKSGPSTQYYLIDLAFYQDRQFLFFDHAYFELNHLLAVRERADAANWHSILDHLSPFDHFGEKTGLRGDDLGLLELVLALRQEAMNWVDRHQEARLSYMERQYLLARVAVGLNFTHKNIAEKLRRMAFIYAAANLKDYLRLASLEWPKHGPLYEIPEASAPVVATPAKLPDAQVGQAAMSQTVPEHLPLPDKPSIAVLAFENLSGDPSQEYFSDGVTQEIITALSRIDWLMVIARGSSFAYKDHQVDIKQIGRELGVHYIVAGSLRKAGNRVRVAVQLIDAANSTHLWAEQYDEELGDIFEMQEEIARAIAASIDSSLKFAERERAQHQPDHLGVWEKFQDALWHFFKFTDDHSQVTQEYLSKIIDEAPNFAPAYALQALLLCRRINLCETDSPDTDLKVAREHAKRAVQIDDRNSLAHVALSRVLSLEGDYDGSLDQAQLAVSLNPSSSAAQCCLAVVHYWSGKASLAVGLLDTSIRLSPKGPFLSYKLALKAICLYVLDQSDDAEKIARRTAYGRNVGPLPILALVGCLVRLGRQQEAEAMIAELAEMRPRLTLDRLKQSWPNLWPDYLDRFLQDLKAAGLKE